MIMHLIETLPKEVDKIILAVNYRKDQIEKYFKENDCGKKIIVNDEPKPLGTGGATKFAQEHITDKFFVLNADVIASINLADMIKFHEKNDAKATISLWPVKNVSEFGVVDITEDGKILDFVEKPKPEDAPSDLINAGAYIIEPEILDYIPTKRLVSMEKEIFPQIIEKTGKFYGYKFDGYWMDIGRITSYLKVNEFLLDKNNLKNCIGKNCNIEGKISKSSIGNNVKIAKNCNINKSVIYDNAIIEENSNLTNCVVGENCRLAENSNLVYTVLGDNEKLKSNQTKENEIIWTQEKPKEYPDKQIGNVIER
jgi:mannose-1-phosphate guanylyltransferase